MIVYRCWTGIPVKKKEVAIFVPAYELYYGLNLMEPKSLYYLRRQNMTSERMKSSRARDTEGPRKTTRKETTEDEMVIG